MATLQELIDQRQAIADQLAALDAKIAALTAEVPRDWVLEPGEGLEPDGITLNGISPDGANVAIVMFRKKNGDQLVYIKNTDNGGRGKAVDITAMKAAVAVYERKQGVEL